MTDVETPPAADEKQDGRRTWSAARRQRAIEAQDRRRAESAATGARPQGRRQRVADGVELVAEEVVGEAVANVVTLCGFVMPFAPYVAVTLAGVPHPEQENAWLVKSRAEMAGNVLLEHAKRDRRVLAAIDRFNRLFTNVEVVEVVGGVVAAAAVDAHLIEPDASIALPGGVQMPLLAPVIGDTVAYIAAQQEAAQGPAQQGDRREPEWGVARASAADGTVRHEGQTVIVGGVEDT